MENKHVLDQIEKLEIDDYEQECIKTAVRLQLYNEHDLKKMKDDIVRDLDRRVLE